MHNPTHAAGLLKASLSQGGVFLLTTQKLHPIIRNMGTRNRAATARDTGTVSTSRLRLLAEAAGLKGQLA